MAGPYSEGTVRVWDLRTAGRGGGAMAATAAGQAARDEPLSEATGGGRFTCMVGRCRLTPG